VNTACKRLRRTRIKVLLSSSVTTCGCEWRKCYKFRRVGQNSRDLSRFIDHSIYLYEVFMSRNVIIPTSEHDGWSERQWSL